MGISANVRANLECKGYTTEEIDLRFHNLAQIWWLAPITIVSGFILLIILAGLIFEDSSPDWNVTGLLLIGSIIVFVPCIKKFRSMSKAESVMRALVVGGGYVQATAVDPAPVAAIQSLSERPSESKVTRSTKEGASTIGIVAVGLAFASLIMPYFAAVLFVPAALICAVIALRQGDKTRGGFAIVFAAVGLYHIITVSNQIDDAQRKLQTELRTLSRETDQAQRNLENSIRSLR